MTPDMLEDEVSEVKATMPPPPMVKSKSDMDMFKTQNSLV
jgi:hypothetical protein